MSVLGSIYICEQTFFPRVKNILKISKKNKLGVIYQKSSYFRN